MRISPRSEHAPFTCLLCVSDDAVGGAQIYGEQVSLGLQRLSLLLMGGGELRRVHVARCLLGPHLHEFLWPGSLGHLLQPSRLRRVAQRRAAGNDRRGIPELTERWGKSSRLAHFRTTVSLYRNCRQATATLTDEAMHLPVCVASRLPLALFSKEGSRRAKDRPSIGAA